VEAVSSIGMVNGQPAQVHNVTGSATEFHQRDLPFSEGIEIWVLNVTSPALVLGSRQDAEILNPVGVRAGGYEVVRRRSGGTLVHLIPGEVLWLDVVVPASDRRFLADLRASMIWMGEQWATVLHSVSSEAASTTPVAGEPPRNISVYAGPVQSSPWADLLCFGGLGPGEVTVDGAKLVGISQRRSRLGARFQMAIHKRFEIADVADVWAVPLPATQDLPAVATLDRCGVISDRDLVDLLARQLSR